MRDLRQLGAGQLFDYLANEEQAMADLQGAQSRELHARAASNYRRAALAARGLPAPVNVNWTEPEQAEIPSAPAEISLVQQLQNAMSENQAALTEFNRILDDPYHLPTDLQAARRRLDSSNDTLAQIQQTIDISKSAEEMPR